MPGYVFYTWFSRIGGLIFLILFTLFFYGEGLPDILNGKGEGLLYFLPFALPSLVGYFLAWFRPYAGGLLMVLGGIILASWFLWRNDVSMSIVYALPSLMIGLSFIAAARKKLI